MQLSVILSMVGVFFALTVVHVVAVVANTSPQNGADSAVIRRLAFLTTGGYFAVALVATLIVGLKVTQKIAGPARVIEQAVRALRRGDFCARLELRDGDYLKSLAAEVSALRSDTQLEGEHRRAMDAELLELLDAGKSDAVRERLRQRLRAGACPTDVGLDDEQRSHDDLAA